MTSIEKVDYSLSDESLRAMIKDTIIIHFEKEKELFDKGIKALTLFFMQNDISLYRGDNPKIKDIFEEEYKNKRDEIIKTLDPNSEYYCLSPLIRWTKINKLVLYSKLVRV